MRKGIIGERKGVKVHLEKSSLEANYQGIVFLKLRLRQEAKETSFIRGRREEQKRGGENQESSAKAKPPARFRYFYGTRRISKAKEKSVKKKGWREGGD